MQFKFNLAITKMKVPGTQTSFSHNLKPVLLGHLLKALPLGISGGLASPLAPAGRTRAPQKQFGP